MSIRFSIIVVDYDQSVKRQYMQRAIQSVIEQTINPEEVELILLHDGPKQTPYEQELSPEEILSLIHI